MCARIHFPTCVTENPEKWMRNDSPNFLPGTHGTGLVSRANRNFSILKYCMENVKIIYMKLAEKTSETKVHERGEDDFSASFNVFSFLLSCLWDHNKANSSLIVEEEINAKPMRAQNGERRMNSTHPNTHGERYGWVEWMENAQQSLWLVYGLRRDIIHRVWR